MINLRGLGAQWRRWDVTVRDLPLAVLLAGAALVPAFRGAGTTIGDLQARPFDLLAFAVVLLQCLPLAVRRRLPLLCIGLVSIGFAVDQLRGYHTVGGTGFAIALLSTGAHLERHRRLTAAVLAVAYVPFGIALHRLGSPDPIQDFVTFYLFLVVAWIIGAWWRHTRRAEAERRRLIAETTRTGERTRIARDLHDVVTHHVTAMVVQAEAARYLTSSPDRLDEALTGISGTGRRAISDLRNLLDLLNPDHTMQDHRSLDQLGQDQLDQAQLDQDRHPAKMRPHVDDLRSLVEQTRLSGQPVEFCEDGTGEASDSAELALYRVVQESLTNALKYAHGSRTVVRVQRSQRQICVRISTDGTGTYDSPGGSGQGLAGLRERVRLLGGQFSADREPDGGFAVWARIPTGSLP